MARPLVDRRARAAAILRRALALPSRSMAIMPALFSVPAVKRHVEQFALQHRRRARAAARTAPSCPTCSYAWRRRARHARGWARALRNPARENLQAPEQQARTRACSRICAAPRGISSAGRKPIFSTTDMTSANHTKKIAERRSVMGQGNQDARRASPRARLWSRPPGSWMNLVSTRLARYFAYSACSSATARGSRHHACRSMPSGSTG